MYEPFFPPPWNIDDYPEKTEGWIEFQKLARKDPCYYLGHQWFCFTLGDIVECKVCGETKNLD